MDKLNKFKNGQSLFEVLVAVGVTAVTLVAIIGLVSSTINNSSFSRDRTLAARYTQEAYEWLRGRRDRDWGNLTSISSSSGAVYCLRTLPDYPTNPTSGTCNSSSPISNTLFYREMVLTYDQLTDPNTVEVEISTTWNDSSGVHESRVSTSLTNWRTF